MSVENEKEIQQLKNRIRELADKSYNQNQYTFTGFLGLAEQDALWQVEREVKFAGITLYGGREEAERKLLRFGSEAELGYEQPFPICCIRIRPLSAKFADKLSHRDYLVLPVYLREGCGSSGRMPCAGYGGVPSGCPFPSGRNAIA